jgi:hypothetical protein
VNGSRATSLGRKVRIFGLYAAIVALAVLVRLPFLTTADCINSDACVVALMARHFAEGEFTPYFWGQRYMAAFEPLLLTPLAAFGLATATGSVVVALAIALVQLYQVTRIARSVGAPPWLAALVFALPAAVPASHQMALWGARHVATCLGLWAIERALSGKLDTPRGALGTGAILGLAFFGDHLTLAFSLPLAYAAYRRGTLRALLVAAIPFGVLDLVLSLTSAMGRHSLPQDPRDWLRGFRLFTSSALPRVFGLDWLDPSLRLTPSADWLVLSLGGLVAFAVFAVLLVRRLRENTPALEGPRLLTASVLLVCAFHVIGALDQESSRYLLLALGPFAVLVAWIAAHVRPRSAVLLVVGLLLPRVPSVWRYHDALAGRGAACRAELAALAGAIDRSGARGVFADYWDAYRLALAAEERFPIGIPLRANRHPCWNHWARQASPIAYVAPDERHTIYEKVSLAAPGVRWTEVGRRRIAVVPHALAGLDGPEPRAPPPECAR